MANNFYISILFDSSSKSYYFSTDNSDLKIGDYVVVETTIGKEIGHVVAEPKPLSTLRFDFEVKPILRKALPSDLQIYKENKKLAKEASDLFEENINQMNLDMRLITSEYTLDRSKILFIYASDNRIDFRELLKILASKLHCRIELKQINARERAQAIGGLGICGLPICCATFFKTFDGISITRAKNQMLTINIPKLSGLCGKLMCCLKYEDDLYTELKKEFPPVNSFITYNKEKYKITGFNVLTKIVKIENENNTMFVHLNELIDKKPKEYISNYLHDDVKTKDNHNQSLRSNSVSSKQTQGEKNNENRHQDRSKKPLVKHANTNKDSSTNSKESSSTHPQHSKQNNAKESKTNKTRTNNQVKHKPYNNKNRKDKVKENAKE